MSNALAIAGITAVLKDRLHTVMQNYDLSSIGSYSIMALPPDRVANSTKESNVLNLFLYQVTPNLGWRNADLASRDSAGARLSNPPLAIDLHYLMSAYGAQDLAAEVLLGFAMQVFHQFPGVSRDQLRTILNPGPFGTISAADLADQIEAIKISPLFLSTEELSKLWTAMQERYRPSMAYQVSVLLIQGTNSTKSALPVLKRGADDRGPTAVGAPFPSLAGVRPAATETLPAMRLGDDLILSGSNLAAQSGATAVLANAKAGLTQMVATTPAVGSLGALSMHVPSAAEQADTVNQWAIGLYAVSLRVETPNLPVWSTNEVPIALAPSVSIGAPPAPPNFHVGELLTITCSPRILSPQEGAVSVLFGSLAVTPKSITTPTGSPAALQTPTTVTVIVPDLFPDAVNGTAAVIVRLRVDGIDSLPVIVSGSPPTLAFDAAQKVTVQKP